MGISALRIEEIFPEPNIPFPCKGLLIWCSSSLFPCILYPGYFVSGYSQSHIFNPNDILYCVFIVCSVFKTMLNLKCHTCSGKVTSFCREQLGPELVVLPSIWTAQKNWLSQQWKFACWALWHISLSFGGEGSDVPHVWSSHSHMLRVERWVHWADVLESCCYWCKGWSIWCVVQFDEQD